MTDKDIPEPQGRELIEEVEFASCDCGGRIVLRVWGEGIDSEVWCVDCGEKNIYR